MKYKCGTDVMLGDEILVAYGPGQEALARVVAIGSDLVINEIDQGFYSWAKSVSSIDEETVVIEWLEANPLSHDGPNYSPIGNYMILQSICCETFIKRGRR